MSSITSAHPWSFATWRKFSLRTLRWVSAPPVSSHRNNSADLPLVSTFLYSNCRFSYLSSLPSMPYASGYIRRHRGLLAFLKVWPTLQWVLSKQQRLTRGGRDNFRERMANVQISNKTELPEHSQEHKLSEKQLLRTQSPNSCGTKDPSITIIYHPENTLFVLHCQCSTDPICFWTEEEESEGERNE